MHRRPSHYFAVFLKHSYGIALTLLVAGFLWILVTALGLFGEAVPAIRQEWQSGVSPFIARNVAAWVVAALPSIPLLGAFYMSYVYSRLGQIGYALLAAAQGVVLSGAVLFLL